MKLQWKKLAIRVSIRFLQGLIVVGGVTLVAARALAPYLARIFHFLGRITILPGYKLVLRSVRIARSTYDRSRGRVLIHLPEIALAVIFLFALGSNLHAQTANPEEVGSESLLFSLIAGEDQEFFAAQNGDEVDFDTFEEEEGLSTIEGGSAIVKPGVAGGRTAIVYHVVAPGETLSSIAERYQIDINSILYANKMTVHDFIRPGNRLTIPPVAGVLHVVRKGDTIKKLAQFYRADSEKILAFNHLTEDAALPVGETLIIPSGRPPPPPAPPPRAPAAIGRILEPAVPGTGRYVWPTAARRITQYFRWRHSGVDIGLPLGNPIYAADDGIVVFAGWSRGYGNRVDINHGDGIVTRYGHSSRLLVSVGDQVSKGQVIALIGSTGRSTGPHLHFEVIVFGRRVNPLKYIR